MVDRHPLLAPFLRSGSGFVLYKGYQPQRGDDVTALLALASALPETVQFAPIPPHWNTVNDLRRLLPELIRHVVADVASERDLDSASTKQESIDAQDLKKAVPVLTTMVEQALVQVGSPIKPDQALARMHESHPQLQSMLLRVLATNPENLARLRGLESSGPDGLNPDKRAQRDLLRSLVHLPQDVPILIVGRPELFFGYYPWSDYFEETDLRRILHSAGYPNRYHFTDRRAEWLAASPESAPILREQRTPPIRDRKTFRVYSTSPEGRRREDVGFVLASRAAHGQVVMVATGSTSLGTYAAVQLLLQERHGFADAMAALERDNSKAIDIGFYCRHDVLGNELGNVGRLPRPRGADHLAIELLNPADLTGYSWSRNAHTDVRPILNGRDPTGSLGQDPFVKWTWTHGDTPLTDVVISATPYNVSPERQIYPSEALGTLLDRVKADLKVDRKNWLSSLEDSLKKYGESFMSAVRSDRSFKTFRPVLLLGGTGTGKDWIAELIANEWGGQTVEARLESTPPARSEDPHQKVEKQWLRDDIVNLIKGVQKGAERMYALSVVETPETLLHSQLFGLAPGAANDVLPRLSAFVIAGTGVLFLDELLELEKSLQSRLLVALQTGKVLPIGSTTHRPYFCRIVAATNKAETEADLRRLTESKDVRPDLVARFSRYYEVPPLERRPLEIVPILMDTLLRERSTSEARPQCLRMSGPALELLLTHSYPENIRQLMSFALTLDHDLVASFSRRLSANDDLNDQSICLRHLGRFGIPHGNIHGQLASSRHIEISGEVEDSFYQFTFPALEATRAFPSLDDTSADDLSPALRDLCDKLDEGRDGWLQRMCTAGRSITNIQTLREVVNSNDEFRDGLARLTALLTEAHNKLKPDGLNEKKVKQLFDSAAWSRLRVAMPLQHIPKNLLTQWGARGQDLSPDHVFELNPVDAVDRAPAIGRPRSLHQYVLASFLGGLVVFPSR
jgi:hypothetical protein